MFAGEQDPMYPRGDPEGRDALVRRESWEHRDAVVRVGPLATKDPMEDREPRMTGNPGIPWDRPADRTLGRPAAPHVTAVVNHKGGSGKTTAVVNLAAALAERDWRVLVVDLDPQCTATRWLGFEPLSEQGLSRLLAGRARIEDLTVVTDAEGLDLVPGDDWLEIAERRDFEGAAVPQLALGRALDTGEKAHHLVLIDTPGRLSLLTIAALAAADSVCTPVPASAMELEHLSDLDQTIAEVRAINPDLAWPWLVPWAVDVRTVLARDVMARLRATHPQRLLPVSVRKSVRAAEAFAHRQPLTAFAPDHPLTDDFRRLAVRIEEGACLAHASRTAI